MHTKNTQAGHPVPGFWNRLKFAIEGAGLSPLERLERRVQFLESALEQMSGPAGDGATARAHRKSR